MKITLEHGSGGRKTDELIRRHFTKYIHSAELEKFDDAGFIGEDLVMSTDTFVVNPIFFPGGNIGDLAIAGTVNDLASMGAEPLYFSLGFILEEGLRIEDLERILQAMSMHINRLGISVVAADTKVVEARDRENPGLFINSTGIGKIYRRLEGIGGVEPGDRVIVTGAVGEHGFAVLAHRLNLSTPIKSDTKPLWPLVKHILDHFNVKFMRDPTRGGIAQVLNEIVQGKSWGIEIYEERIPVKEEVRGVSELLGIDPLEVANEGNMLIIVKKEISTEILELIKSHPYGKDASIIGEIVEEHPGKVALVNPYGAKRVLYKPSGEKLPRIC